MVYCNHWLGEKCSSIVNTWLFYFTNTQFSGWLVDIFHIVALPRHVVRHAADDVVVLEGLLDHLLPLPPHLQNSLEWVQAVNLASVMFQWDGSHNEEHTHVLVQVVLDEFVQGNEGSRPPDPGTAVDKDGAGSVAKHLLLQIDTTLYLGLQKASSGLPCSR